jgi:hypothetical protein
MRLHRTRSKAVAGIGIALESRLRLPYGVLIIKLPRALIIVKSKDLTLTPATVRDFPSRKRVALGINETVCFDVCTRPPQPA